MCIVEQFRYHNVRGMISALPKMDASDQPELWML